MVSATKNLVVMTSGWGESRTKQSKLSAWLYDLDLVQLRLRLSLRFYYIEIKTFLLLQREIVPAVKIFQFDNSSQLRQNAFSSLFF